MLRRWLRRLLFFGGCLCLLLGVAYSSLVGYLAWRERVAPSTRQVLMLKDGRQIPLAQPTLAPTAAVEQPVAVSAAVSMDARVQPASAPTAAPAPTVAPTPQPLPPERIRIPSIGVDWPVVLGDNQNLPRFKAVGWFMGSGWPGRPGNMVLFGHLGGRNGTFMRLHELRPGDELSVSTAAGETRYRVRELHETMPDDVAVLAPTSGATATLITCSGPWDPVAQTNQRRLIVNADLIENKGQ